MSLIKNQSARSDIRLIMIMFSVVLTCGAILGIASYYGESDWTWIANILASLVLVFMVLACALYVLFEWVR